MEIRLLNTYKIDIRRNLQQSHTPRGLLVLLGRDPLLGVGNKAPAQVPEGESEEHSQRAADRSHDAREAVLVVLSLKEARQS